MGIYAVKPRFRRLLRGTARTLAGRGVMPDQVTTAGVVAGGLGALAFAVGGRWRGAFATVPVLALARTAANALDGLVAEESGLGRPAGELYNETADRLGDIAFLAGTAAVPGVPPALALGALAAAELSSFVGVSAKAAGGRRRYEGPMGKPDRMLVLGAAGLAAALARRPARALNAGLALIAAGALVTAANRYRRAHAELDAARG
ncbi:MAG TPA: CDP-alcohol phosphatidyltransferase family protein [Actinomycetota bacterium]|jgi:CDP-diacylglycerol---glycerol-3-phosphate 3-phosphatidyltransferase